MEIQMQLIHLLEPIRPEMECVERLLHETVADVEEPLNSMLCHSLSGGKRLRAALAILIGRMLCPSGTPFHNLGAAIEMLHTATLIHDDLVDGASLRRGHKTLHMLWSPVMAVLAGDFLLARSASLLAGLDNPRIMKIFAETLCTMCNGEISQLLTHKEGDKRWENYYRNVAAKAASLFAATTEMAGILAGAEELQVAALRRFGWELGIAFQIVDDVLDFVGDEAQLGKPAGSDLRQGLLTLPTLYYLDKIKDDATVNAVLSGQQDEKLVQAAIKAICTSGAIEASLAEAMVHVKRSQEALATWRDNASCQILCSLAEYVVERKH